MTPSTFKSIPKSLNIKISQQPQILNPTKFYQTSNLQVVSKNVKINPFLTT